jgi:hypothetical protein
VATVTTRQGRLQGGGPHDGTTFDTNDRFWYAAAGNQLPEPARRVYVTGDGRLLFWFTETVVIADAPGPLLSRYDLDTDDNGWLYTYVGEQTP